MNKVGDTRIGRRTFLKGTAAAAIGIDCLGMSRRFKSVTLDPQTAVDKAASLKYDMLVFGADTVYLSLLPRFSLPEVESPNRYQLILEASLTNEEKVSGRPQNISMKDLDLIAGQDSGREKKYFTLNTKRFDIEMFFSRLSSTTPAISFSGTIFRGQLEKGGKPIIENVLVTIKRCIYSCELNSKASECNPTAFETDKSISQKPTKNSQLEYLLFGNESGLFSAHRITRPPDFDQILYLGNPQNIEDILIRRTMLDGVRVTFPQRSNSVRQRLRVGRMDNGQIQLRRLVALRLGQFSDTMLIQVTAEKEIYFEEGELRVPPEFATTPAEKEAGFP